MFRRLFFFIAILPSFFAASPPYPQNHSRSFYALDRLIRAHKWHEAGIAVRKGLTSEALSPIEIEMVATTYPDTPFANAYAGAKALLSLPEKTGLTLATAFPITLFAESRLAEEILRGTFFWTTHQYGRELQYDPEAATLYIHLGVHGVKPIGAGRMKVVTRTIQYHRSSPVIMARSLSEYGLEREMAALRELKASPGLINAEALMTHKKPGSKRNVQTIITKIYNSGSLLDVMDNPRIRLSFREKLAIATDIITGLASIHEHHYVHRDLSARNCFVNIEREADGRRQIRTVIADFGRAIPISRAAAVGVQGNKGYIAPEGFFRDKLRQADYYSTDIFAVGTTLWHLYYGCPPPWQVQRYFTKTALPLKKRQQLVINSIKRARFGPSSRLRDKKRSHRPLTLSDKFARLILQMTNPVPSKRGTAGELLKMLQALQNR